MNKRIFYYFVLTFILSFVLQNVLSASDFVSRLKKEAKEKNGVQVGLVVDPYSSGKPVIKRVVTLTKLYNYKDKNKKMTVYDVLENSNVLYVTHPSYSSPESGVYISPSGKRIKEQSMGVMILSMIGVNPTKTKKWIFFSSRISSDNKVTWSVAEKGISNTGVKDGDLVGFSLTEYENIKGPRI